MSSLRNAVKRIAHKERSQPTDRQHLGILEKKKDYKQRAIDYHRKEDRIKIMQQKASMKNPDEFYFRMHSSHIDTTRGKHRSNDDYRNLNPELLKVMKGQDLSYVRMQKQKDMKKVQKLQSTLHLLDTETKDDSESKARRKHTIFVETKDEAENFDISQHFDTIPEFAGRAFNRLRKQDVEKIAKRKSGLNAIDRYGDYDDNDELQEKLTTAQLEKQASIERKQARKLAKAREKAYGEMEARRKRAEEMKKAEDHLITEKLVAGKGRKRKIKAAEDGRPAQYKWRRKRLG